MDPREFNHIDQVRATMLRPTGSGFRVELCLEVRDPRALWSAAAAKALATGLLLPEDLVETLGPVDDPSLADCIAMLAGPAPVAGCELTAFAVTERHSLPGFDAALAA